MIRTQVAAPRLKNAIVIQIVMIHQSASVKRVVPSVQMITSATIMNDVLKEFARKFVVLISSVVEAQYVREDYVLLDAAEIVNAKKELHASTLSARTHAPTNVVPVLIAMSSIIRLPVLVQPMPLVILLYRAINHPRFAPVILIAAPMKLAPMITARNLVAQIRDVLVAKFVTVVIVKLNVQNQLNVLKDFCASVVFVHLDVERPLIAHLKKLVSTQNVKILAKPSPVAEMLFVAYQEQEEFVYVPKDSRELPRENVRKLNVTAMMNADPMNVVLLMENVSTLVETINVVSMLFAL